MPKPDPEDFHRALTASIEDPYPVYRRYRDAGALHRVLRPGSGREPEWLVLRYEEAAAVLAGRGFGRRASVAGVGPETSVGIVPPRYRVLSALVDNWLVFMDPPRHTRLRAVVAECLAARMRSGTRARVREIVRRLVDRLAAEPTVDLVERYAALIPVLTMLELLGVPSGDQDWLRERAAVFQRATTFRPGPREPRLVAAEEAARALAEYFRAALAERRATPGNDLLSALLAELWDDDLAAEDVLIGTCVHLLLGGHEATTTALSKSALLLLRQPGVLATLRSRPELVPAAVDEFIRYDSPAQMVTRWAYQDETVGGHRIRRGDKVTVVLGAANRDPDRFEQPDTVRFDRDGHRHCGFGMGAHYCLGSALGRIEVEAGVEGLLTMLPGLRLADDAVPYRQDLVFHGPRRLATTRRE
ncbi:cytochrome P450 [Streptomyces sp. NBC_01803]|uniref:cytochrome P450 n=1 Tax=Streptomyces sp. NBC_01803 TaxID=2975946 RepID=UPI002DDC2687|nr:cytochrome P450 [Streptomyces sp. NBC_01803]WSA42876.1 cytochrome P450 [Streptomyces sp. NBC_01803]